MVALLWQGRLHSDPQSVAIRTRATSFLMCSSISSYARRRLRRRERCLSGRLRARSHATSAPFMAIQAGPAIYLRPLLFSRDPAP